MASTVTLFSSCNTEKEYLGEPANNNSYILGYYSFSEISSELKDYDSNAKGSFHRISINPKGSRFQWWTVYDTDRSQYDKYCALNHDTTYPTRLLYSCNNAAEHESCYPASNFNSISLTCLSGWDMSHPAGSSLDDITTYVTVTVKPYIESGYVKYDYNKEREQEFIQESFGYAIYNLGSGVFYPVCKRMNDVSTDDLSLIGSGVLDGDFTFLTQICELYVPKREDGTPCTLRVTMTNTDGVTYTADVEIQ